VNSANDKIVELETIKSLWQNAEKNNGYVRVRVALDGDDHYLQKQYSDKTWLKKSLSL
jgi:hypothetical protein